MAQGQKAKSQQDDNILPKVAAGAAVVAAVGGTILAARALGDEETREKLKEGVKRAEERGTEIVENVVERAEETRDRLVGEVERIRQEVEGRLAGDAGDESARQQRDQIKQIGEKLASLTDATKTQADKIIAEVTHEVETMRGGKSGGAKKKG
jgi:hypothetical protein